MKRPGPYLIGSIVITAATTCFLLSARGQKADTGVATAPPPGEVADPALILVQRRIDPFAKKLLGPKFLLPGAEPRLAFEIENVSDKPVEFSRRPDGTEAYWRFGRITLQVKDSSGKLIPMKPAPL